MKEVELRSILDSFDPFTISIPKGFYVYVLYATTESDPLYVGMSNRLLARIGSHLQGGRGTLRKDFTHVVVIPCSDRAEALKLEDELKRLLNPPLNREKPQLSETRRKPCSICKRPTSSRYEVCSREGCRDEYLRRYRLGLLGDYDLA